MLRDMSTGFGFLILAIGLVRNVDRHAVGCVSKVVKRIIMMNMLFLACRNSSSPSKIAAISLCSRSCFLALKASLLQHWPVAGAREQCAR